MTKPGIFPPRVPMAGIFLYTANGALGGLVRLGRAGALERIFIGALNDAQWYHLIRFAATA